MSLRVGFVGAGGIAGRHLQTLQELREGPFGFTPIETEVVGLCDVREEVAQQKAEQYGGRAYASWEELLAQEEMDALFVCTPPHVHGELELTALERGLPLFIEKPIARDLELAGPIREAVRERGALTAVAYKYRWDGHTHQARELLAGRTQGLVCGWFWTGMPGVPWWRVQAESGGQMVEQTTHIVDLARFLCGEITHVQAFETRQVMHRKAEGCDIADAATANLRFASGAVGNISNTFMIAGGGASGLTVMAEGYRLKLEGDLVQWWAKDESGEIRNEVNGYVAEVEGFLHAVQTGDRSRIFSDYEDAFRSLAVTVAANVSGQGGGQVVEVAALVGD